MNFHDDEHDGWNCLSNPGLRGGRWVLLGSGVFLAFPGVRPRALVLYMGFKASSSVWQ